MRGEAVCCALWKYISIYDDNAQQATAWESNYIPQQHSTMAPGSFWPFKWVMMCRKLKFQSKNVATCHHEYQIVFLIWVCFNCSLSWCAFMLFSILVDVHNGLVHKLIYLLSDIVKVTPVESDRTGKTYRYSRIDIPGNIWIATNLVYININKINGKSIATTQDLQSKRSLKPHSWKWTIIQEGSCSSDKHYDVTFPWIGFPEMMKNMFLTNLNKWKY